MKRLNKTEHRELWMRRFEDCVIARKPGASGKIDWNTATFFYNSGMTPELAAHRYADTFTE